MILQNFVFPKKGICEKEELYYRTVRGNAHRMRAGIRLEKHSSVSFFSYFNEFSLTRWRDYTGIADYRMHLKVSGKGRVQMRRAVLKDGRVFDEALSVREFCTRPDAYTELIFDIAPKVNNGIIYAKIDSKSSVTMERGYFETMHGPAADVRIAVGICTYHREEYVHRTLSLLQKAFLENQHSELYGKLKVYISDNGGTLDCRGESVSCVWNKNAGGSGGFARCMIEALNEWDAYQFTHFLFMDDDILLEPETVYRTYMLLAAGVRYPDAVVGGALLRSDVKEIQHACGENWDIGRIISPKAGLCLTKKRDLLRNEQEFPAQYNGWWYCCVPFGREERDCLPLPLFIHGDDIEYGMRRKKKLLYLNGISVWHDAFENRRASCMEYYDIRNTLLLVSAFCEKKVSKRQVERLVLRRLIGQFLKYRYRDMEMTVRAVKDFCRGAEFLKDQEPEALHQRLLAMGYQPKDMTKELDQLQPEWRNPRIDRERMYVEKHFHLYQILLLNGWLLPGRGKKAALPMGVWAGKLFWIKRVLYYDPETGKGFECSRKYKELRHLIKNGYMVWRLLEKYWDQAVRSYQVNARELTGAEFWMKYLELS